MPVDASAPRSARPSYVLATVSLFVPILVTILLPDADVRLLLVVEILAVAAAIVALALGVRTLMLTRGGGAGRLNGIFGVLLALVSLGYNGPLVVAVVRLLVG